LDHDGGCGEDGHNEIPESASERFVLSFGRVVEREVRQSLSVQDTERRIAKRRTCRARKGSASERSMERRGKAKDVHHARAARHDDTENVVLGLGSVDVEQSLEDDAVVERLASLALALHPLQRFARQTGTSRRRPRKHLRLLVSGKVLSFLGREDLLFRVVDFVVGRVVGERGRVVHRRELLSGDKSGVGSIGTSEEFVVRSLLEDLT
jgi:hypothetical protein